MSAAGKAERYTVVFTGSFPGREPGEYLYLCADGGAGILRRGSPPAGRLEREIPFAGLPESTRRAVLETYRELWNL